MTNENDCDLSPTPFISVLFKAIIIILPGIAVGGFRSFGVEEPWHGLYVGLLYSGFLAYIFAYCLISIIKTKKHNKKLNSDSGADAPPPVN